ncbi:30S ribosomal protein S18 [Deinococcus koreensis]|uniref:Small ribosomal subunit protein bS18 n=1 Tax=Deinococcus koreensis TaxID=2054903 RepID=A0A2K3UXV8_9DEIO|nr:30S ribosomal protein S18 [Deinococcus koreensis]PNY81369.1 30S ribosomal protein S18 [Deinococcus koreensis]
MTQRDNSDRKPRGKGPKRPRKPKVDPFSIGELEITDYKDVKMLRRFVSDTGKILPRRRTGLSAKHQRRISQTIKIARQLALLPYTEKLVRK